MTGWEASILGRAAGTILNLISGRQRELNRERPEVYLKIRHREPSTNNWRSANFSVRNQINQQLIATKITLGWGSWGVRIAPAIIDGDKWHMDHTKIGRTFQLEHILRSSSVDSTRQNVPFFICHPRDLVDDGRHWVKVSILIEHRTDPSRQWWTTIPGQIPQQPGDDNLYSRRGPHR
jgi:hypothetical protein